MSSEIVYILYPFYENNIQKIYKRDLAKAMNFILHKYSSASFGWLVSLASGSLNYNRKEKAYLFDKKKYEELAQFWGIKINEIPQTIIMNYRSDKTWEEVKKELFG